MSDTAYHPIVGKIRELLDVQNVPYEFYEHEAARTSEEAAAVRPEFSLAQGAKALIVRIKKRGVPKEEEKEFVQVVVPGDAKYDSKKVREALNAKDIRFATEDEVADITNGIQPGGIPPFGNLFGVRVLVAQSLYENEEIIFSAGDRRCSIAIASTDHQQVVEPLVAAII